MLMQVWKMGKDGNKDNTIYGRKGAVCFSPITPNLFSIFGSLSIPRNCCGVYYLAFFFFHTVYHPSIHIFERVFGN